MGDIDDRMKMYEGIEAGRRFMPLVPVVARIDGKCFSKFTKGLKRPYDDRFSALMVAVTHNLVEETGACMGYTQSDEITLVWYSDSIKSQIFFDGRIQKMVSVLAGMATAHFTALMPDMLPAKKGELPTFDCRVWTVPTLVEGANVFVWREQDATRNSIQMAASELYSEKQLFKKKTDEMQEMMVLKGVNWNEYPVFFKRGTYVQRRKVRRKFTTTELSRLPVKHEARKRPDLEVERSDVGVLEMPILTQVVNRVDVIFRGADPITEVQLELQRDSN